MSHLRLLVPYLQRYRRRLLLGLLVAALGAAISALGPLVLRIAVDEIAAGTIDLARLFWFGGALIGLALIDGTMKFAQRMLIAVTSYRIENDLRADLFDRLLSLDQAFYQQNYTGDLMARMTNDLSAARQFLGPGLNGAATALLTFISATVLMVFVDWFLALIVVLLLPMATIVFIAIGSRMRQIFHRVQDQFGVLSTRAQENFSGIRTIKAFAQEEDEIAVFTADNERYRDLNLRYVLLSGALWPAMTLCLGLIAALILLVGGRMVAAGELTIGELVQFNAYLALLAFPMIMLGWMVNLYQQATASLQRINEIFLRQPAIASPTVPQQPARQGAVEFRNVGARANTTDHRWILQDVSFHLPAGKTLAIVGATGAGKTTLVNLLGRVRDPDVGQVLIDGVDARELDLAALRRMIGYVPQESFLFSIPLRENIGFGVATIDPDRLNHVIEVSRLVNDLDQFPGGLETMVGERGVTLSGGQKQRVAIARALMRDPQILILDDALSSVDTHTAAQILSGLRAEMAHRTTIIIAQRIATVRDADQIIVLDEGRIVEQGSHQDLLARNGRYAAMYRRELLAAELEREESD
ncbi:ABC transporter ATP-binding protein [Chloroflexus sp.]|uniref:ABC transporter ATP-binding protein n=1 Tax=Chloroflexus sp. TaxID=1904827 RepID=UPI002630E185|nr:ABC transporter ATP-binding protein [uncultured Chloroflexus sp.]